MRKLTTSPIRASLAPPTAPPAEGLILEWNQGRYVYLHKACLDNISVYNKGIERNNEAGGIFLGSYRGPHIEISEVTMPLTQDRRESRLFDRRDPGHQVAAKKAWLRSAETVTFVGEWHTHPEKTPSPSARDLMTWNGLMAKAKEPLFFIIIGWSKNWYGVGYAGRLLIAKPLH